MCVSSSKKLCVYKFNNAEGKSVVHTQIHTHVHRKRERERETDRERESLFA